MHEPEHWSDLPSFGDEVTVLQSVETVAVGIAGLHGTVYGHTTVSVTGVEVVGEPVQDTAINVHFEELGEDHWLSPELVEVQNHGVGAVMTIDGVPKQWTRDESGAWEESQRRLSLREWPTRVRLLVRRLLSG